MSMGNKQGTKLNPNCHSYAETWDALSKSPRVQMSRKRRRRAEGLVYSAGLQDDLKLAPGTPRAPLKTRRLRKRQMLSSASFGEWDFEVERPMICIPTARRTRIIGRVGEDTLRQELKSEWRVTLPDAFSANVSRSVSKKGSSSPRRNFSEEEECSRTDSDLSEYDNEIYSSFISNTTMEAKNTEKEEGMWKSAAAQRVKGKIEEVEGIIHRVSLTSSDWIKNGCNGDEEPDFISDGWRGEVSSGGLQQLQILQQRYKDEDGTQSPVEDKDMEFSEDKLLLAEELHALGEALSQSLQQVLRLEGEKGFKEPKETSCEQSQITEPLNPPSHPRLFASVVPRSASTRSLPADGKISPTSSLSAVRDVSPTTSSTLERLSPILSPLLTSTLSASDQQAETSESHGEWAEPTEDNSFILGSGDRERAVSENVRRDTWEPFTEEDYLFSSGKHVNDENSLCGSLAKTLISRIIISSILQGAEFY